MNALDYFGQITLDLDSELRARLILLEVKHPITDIIVREFEGIGRALAGEVRQIHRVTQRLWATRLDDARLGVLTNMSFQMGVDGPLGFKNTLAIIEAGDYARAADSMMQSLWAKQTPARAARLATQMRTGVWQ